MAIDTVRRFWSSCTFYSLITPSVMELCYNLRYVHRHGRAGEYPWSFRQTAVYQRSSTNSVHSRWIFLQPPSDMDSSLAEIVARSQPSSTEKYFHEPLYTHIILLLSTEREWRQFLTDLEGEVEALVSHTCRTFWPSSDFILIKIEE